MFACVVALLALSAFSLGGVAGQHNQQVVCYLGSWAVYRPGAGKFDIENIDPTLCTSLIYSFVGLNETNFSLVSLDVEYDINKKAIERFVNMKSLNPRLKVLVAIGGWTEGSTKYSTMAKTETSRKAFINSAVQFIQTHKLDGLDLDWEYPSNRGGIPEDKENFVELVKELRKEFNKYGWMLTAAMAAGKSTIETAYDVDDLVDELDFIHIMAYDYHGKWDGKTGLNAPLYYRNDESDDDQVLNVDATVKLYLKLGAPAHKLVLGVGFYGRTFLLSDPTNSGIGSPSLSTAFAGPYTREDGFLGYNEICEKQRAEAGAWNIVWQKSHQAPYMFRDNMWVGYDDEVSLALKVAYAQSLGLGGIMIWSIDTDDFTGVCSPKNIRFPLLRAINGALAHNAEKRPQGTPMLPKPTPMPPKPTPMPPKPTPMPPKPTPMPPKPTPMPPKPTPMPPRPTPMPPKPELPTDDDDSDHDDKIDLDVDNDLNNYKYNTDSSRSSKVGTGGSSTITPALSILVALVMAAVVAR